MVKLQFKPSNNDPDEIIADIIEEEPIVVRQPKQRSESRKEQEQKTIADLEQKIRDLQAENLRLFSTCDRLNEELRSADATISQLRQELLQQQQTQEQQQTIDLSEPIHAAEALARRISRFKFHGAPGIAAEIRDIIAMLRRLQQQI